jgi:hypothetical protein
MEVTSLYPFGITGQRAGGDNGRRQWCAVPGGTGLRGHGPGAAAAELATCACARRSCATAAPALGSARCA